MSDLTNEELSDIIKRYEKILEGRNKNELTINVKDIISQCNSKINFENVKFLLECLHNKRQIRDVIIII